MKKFALLAAVMALWAGTAMAQQATMGSKTWKKQRSGDVIFGVTAADTIPYPLQVDANGRQQVTESAPDQSFNQQALAVINSSGTTLAQRDSSLVPANTIGWRRMALGISYTLKDSASIDHLLLGITVQGSYVGVGDSTTIFTWTRFRAPLPFVTTNTTQAAADTLSRLSVGLRDTSGTILGTLTAGLPQTAGPNEIVVSLPISRQAWSITGSRFLWVVLDGPDGAFQAPYTIIRARPLAAVNSSQAIITYTCPLKYRIDLVGLR